MTEHIQVPINLIKNGDIKAIQNLLPKENLFGRWATHKDRTRGIIVDAYPYINGMIGFTCTNRNGKTTHCITTLEQLTLDPTELVTEKDFLNAPEGTIVTSDARYAREKGESSWSNLWDADDMENDGPWQVLRWGHGNE